MLLQRLARSKSAWKPLSESGVCARTTPAHTSIYAARQRRSIHQVPTLAYEQEFAEHGIGGLLSDEGYNIAWTKYQGLMVDKLNAITAGFDAHTATTKQLVLQYARDPATAALFNHASMAHNNHFFFAALSPAPSELKRHRALQQSLIAAFGSIDTLRNTMLATADAMFGPGFVWLVAAKTTATDRYTWHILSTYQAGTPYPEAGYRRQAQDMSTAQQAQQQQALPSVGAFGPASAAARKDAGLPPGAPQQVEPVLCVNTWEHVYIRDFNVEGKREYLERWWDAINWAEVDVRTPDAMKKSDNSLRNFS